jgi:hypothetical protein
MKTKFQQYDARSDQQLIELSMENSADAVMARNVLEYRKYQATKRQTQLSFRLAGIVASLGLLQLLIAAFNVWWSLNTAVPTTPIAAPSSAALAANTPAPGQLTIATASLSADSAVLKQEITVSLTDASGIPIQITLPAGSGVIILSKDTSPQVCKVQIRIKLDTPGGDFTVDDSIPLAAIGESC